MWAPLKVELLVGDIRVAMVLLLTPPGAFGGGVLKVFCVSDDPASRWRWMRFLCQFVASI